jgi:Zn-dependent peptidase ImmA (M78 family)
MWTIAVSSRHPARRHTYYAAHELGHLWLHVDDADGRHVRCYNFDDYTSPDPREDEAEQVAAWLLGDSEVRAFLDVSQAPTAVLPPPGTSLLEALATRRVCAGVSCRRCSRCSRIRPAREADPRDDARAHDRRRRHAR